MHPIRSIVVPTDFSETSEAAVARAAMLAELDGATLHLVHAVHFPRIATPYEVSVPGAVWEGMRQAAEQQLEATRKAAEERTGRTVTGELADPSDPVAAIEAAVEAHRADLVVMGTHGRGGIQHAILGSVAERTLRSVDRPILAVKESPAQAAEPIARILLAVDFSPHSEQAAEVAGELARGLGASLDVVHVYQLAHDFMPYASEPSLELLQAIEGGAAEGVERVGAGLEARGLSPTLHCRPGRPSALIAELAQELGTQLVVMGTRGHGGLSHLVLGSVAERTLRLAPCSVLTVRAGEQAAQT